jgi:hypothetical protein
MKVNILNYIPKKPSLSGRFFNFVLVLIKYIGQFLEKKWLKTYYTAPFVDAAGMK